MRRFRVRKVMRWGGVQRRPGEIVEELPGRDYKAMLARGAIEPVAAPDAPEPSTPPTASARTEATLPAPKPRGRPPKPKPPIES